MSDLKSAIPELRRPFTVAAVHNDQYGDETEPSRYKHPARTPTQERPS